MNIKNVLKNYRDLFSDAISDLKTKGRRHKQIPNILTLTRLIAAPIFIIPSAIMGNVFLIAFYTIIFSLTDAVDGYIARKFNLISELGKDLDAICDKFFAGTLLIAASCFNPILLFNLVGELVIAGINVKQKVEGKTPSSLYVGKIKTCVLYPLLGAGILNNFVNVESLFHILLAASTSMQMMTISSYLIKYESEKNEKINDDINFYTKPVHSIEEKNCNSNENVKTLENKTIDNHCDNFMDNVSNTEKQKVLLKK